MGIRYEQMDFYDDFHCVGDKCEFHCCNSWKICIDEDSVKKYELSDEINGTNFINRIIAKETCSGTTEYQFGLKKNSDCSFLLPSGLCGIYTELGPEGLCLTCRDYPRSMRLFLGGKFRRLTMSISCPESSRLAIFREQPLKVEGVELQEEASLPIAFMSPNIAPELEVTLLSIREIACEIVRRRDIPLQKRLAALVIIASNASKNGNLESVSKAKAIFHYSQSMLKKNLSEIPELPTLKEEQFIAFLEVCFTLSAEIKSKPTNKLSDSLFFIIRDSLNGIDITKSNNVTTRNLRLYTEGYEKYLRAYEEEKPYVYENLVLYHLIHSGIFLINRRPPIESLTNILSCILLVRGLCHGLAIKEERIDDQLLNKVIYTVHRNIEHSDKTTEDVISTCKGLEGLSKLKLCSFFT